MTRYYLIGWPEERKVSEEKMRQWVDDAVDSGDITGPKSLDTDTLFGQMVDEGLLSGVGPDYGQDLPDGEPVTEMRAWRYDEGDPRNMAAFDNPSWSGDPWEY